MDDRYEGYAFVFCGRNMRVWRSWENDDTVVEVIATRELVYAIGWVPKRPPLVLKKLDARLFLALGDHPTYLPFIFVVPKLLCMLYAGCMNEGLEMSYFKTLLTSLDDIADSVRTKNAKTLLRYL